MRAKPANQLRSQQKRDLLINALEALLLKKPFNKISIAEIAAKAGVTPATIYQRFSNQDAAASILLELYFQRVGAWSSKSSGNTTELPTLKLRNALLKVSYDAWDQVSELQHIMRPAYLYSRLRPDLVGDTWQALEEVAVNGFLQFLKQYADELPEQSESATEKVAGVLCYFFNFMVAGKLLHPNEDHWVLLQDRETFAAELSTFAYLYLTADSASDRHA